MTRVFFLSLLSRNINDQLSSKFHRFVILCIVENTPSEKNGLRQLLTCIPQLKLINSEFLIFLHNFSHRSISYSFLLGRGDSKTENKTSNTTQEDDDYDNNDDGEDGDGWVLGEGGVGMGGYGYDWDDDND